MLRYSISLFLVVAVGLLWQTIAFAQSSSGLGAPRGLQSSGGLRPAKLRLSKIQSATLNPDGKRESDSNLAPRQDYKLIANAGRPQPKVPIIDKNVYPKLKSFVTAASPPSIHRVGVIGVLIANDHRINPDGSFVVEFSKFSENKELVYIIPHGMDELVAFERRQILNLLEYPPEIVFKESTAANVKLMEDWLIYTEEKLHLDAEAKLAFQGIIDEAEEYIERSKPR